MYHMICDLEKRFFHCRFAKYAFKESPKVPPHAGVKAFFRIYGSFFKIDVIPLGVYQVSICAIFKVNENAPSGC